MNRTAQPGKHWRLALAALLLACLANPAAAQSDEEKTRAQLQLLQRDIQRISKEISSARARRDSLQAQLRKTEVELGNLQRNMAENRTAIAAANKELVALEARRGDLQEARDGQQERVVSELRAAWQMGKEAQLKVLLNQQNPHTVSRVLAYYQYFFAARSDLLTRYRETLDQLDQLESEIGRTSAHLEDTRQALEQQELSLGRALASREQAVASLSADIKSKGGQLQQLERDRSKLEELLKVIEEAVVNLKVPENFQAFAAAKGKMPWPVANKPSNHYGKSRNEGKMRWQGLTIPAREGTSVKAIHHGRVVYADWFRGSGLLLIIDHGGGYMSLYAHNQSLLLEVGEWVTAGTPISTVGSSGGLEHPALYFEIRHNGKPTNPSAWCRG